jgi:diketogulonate reductase-like aldo/keto reductase
MRSWCSENSVHFQSFWTLTANKKSGGALKTESFQELAAKYNVSAEALFFRFVMGIGVCPLTGTTSAEHMAADLSAREVPLTEEDAQTIDAMLI